MAQQVIDVSRTGDVGAARRAAREMTLAIGFDTVASEEVALAVTELATNLVKHAHGGTIHLGALEKDGRRGIEVTSQDYGPGLRDVEAALRDGSSTATTLGYGLGAVNRLMDTLEIASHAPEDGGTRIVSRRWLAEALHPGGANPLQVGVASRPHPAELTNGDSFVIVSWDHQMLVGVIDGLGHGPFAHRAAETARQYIEAHYEQPLEAIFAGVGRACLATRGVVMALVGFRWQPAATENPEIAVSIASIGNVDVRIIDAPERIEVLVRRGVLGLNAPPAVVSRGRWHRPSVLVIYSDGVRAHWRKEDFAELWGGQAATIAQHLLVTLGRDTDDATVLVVRHKGSQGEMRRDE